MSTDYGQKEREFLESLKADTGRDLGEWMAAISGLGVSDKNDIIDWLRQQGFMFSKASWLERVHHNGGRPIYAGQEGDTGRRSRQRAKTTAPAATPASAVAEAVTATAPPAVTASPTPAAPAAPEPDFSPPAPRLRRLGGGYGALAIELPPPVDLVAAPPPAPVPVQATAPVAPAAEPVVTAAHAAPVAVVPPTPRPQAPPQALDAAAALDAVLAKAKGYRPLAQYLMRELQRAVPDARVEAENGHIVFSTSAVFALLQVSAKDVRLHLDLGDRPVKAPLVRGRLGEPYSRLAHAMPLDDARQLTDELIALVAMSARRIDA